MITVVVVKHDVGCGSSMQQIVDSFTNLRIFAMVQFRGGNWLRVAPVDVVTVV